MTLTPRQRAILTFIADSVEADGLPPTVREIARKFGIASPNGVRGHLEALRRKGYLKPSTGGRRRALALTEEARRRPGVPIVGAVAAGTPILAEENRLGTLDAGELFGRDGVFAVEVRGDSMRDAGIRDGDWAVVRMQPEAASGTIAVAYLGEEATVKRVVRTKAGWRLVPANPAFAPRDVGPDDDFRLAGPVVGLVRRLG